MRFEFTHTYHFCLKYHKSYRDIEFVLTYDNIDSILICCQSSNTFTFSNYFSPPLYFDDFIKGITENQKEFDLYMKKIRFQTSPFFIGI